MELEGYFDSPEDHPARWLLVYRAYIDEVGHEGKGWMFLAGFLGNEDQWKQFVPKWRKALGPQRPFLHMHGLRWKNDGTRKLLERLGPIPDECKLTPVFCGVNYRDYEDLVVGTPEEKNLKGYLACIAPMVMQILRVLPNNERLELVFEEQRQYQLKANLMLQMGVVHATAKQSYGTTTDGLPKLAKWGFVKKGSTIMTDPADYLAFALCQIYKDQNSQRSKWCGPILKSGNGEGVGGILKRDLIRRMVINTQKMAVDMTVAQEFEHLMRGQTHEGEIRIPKIRRRDA